MNTYAKHIRPAVDAQLRAAREAEARGRSQAAFAHLERAHVLGQACTVLHVRAHAQMLLWALRHHVPREVAGQIVRIVGAATKTAWGWVPTGNTGGSNVSPFRSMPIAPELQAEIDDARRAARTARRH